MNTVANGLLRVYPKAWQVRYREEMSDLLSNHKVTFHTLMDLTLGAVKAQLFWERKGLWRIQLTVGCAILSMLCACGYGVIQQNMRHSANFPQQTIVDRASVALASGADVRGQIPDGNVNVQSSLEPFLIVYNNSGTVVGSNVHLNGNTPTLPRGVFDYARTHGVDKLTWQPTSTTRIAAVIEYYEGNGGGFVLSGRSLRVVEDEETSLLRITEWTWAGILGAFSAFLIYYRRSRLRSSIGGRK